MKLPNMAEVRSAVTSRYGLEKLLDLPASKFDDAMAFIERIAASSEATSAPVDDPFFN